MNVITNEELDKILEEVAEYHIDMVEDPTLPQYGVKYLQEILAKCRTYQNRVHSYLQHVKKYEKNLKREIRERELDIEMKMSGLLADDPAVRAQSSIDDRKAVASSMLRTEHEELIKFKVTLVDVDSTLKLIKLSYDHLNKTSQDIRLQRQLVKDELNPDGGMSPGDNRGFVSKPVTKQINPIDLLDPNKRPDDLPVPKDEGHAKQIAAFFSSKPIKNHYARTPGGYIDNCALANGDDEKNCQICNGNCPDKSKFDIKKTVDVPSFDDLLSDD